MSEATAQLPHPFDDPAIRAFAETAARLYASEDLDDTLRRISTALVDTIEACDVASVTLVEPGRVVTRGATDELAERLDAIQYELGEGPCLEAASTERFVYTADTGSDDRWPRFSERVRESRAVGSMMSFRLAVQEYPQRSLGAINAYSRRIDAFGRDDQALLALVAAHAGAVVDASVHQANLRLALESRQTIGMAVGILMERFKISAEQAFDQLRETSQRLNIKLREIAQRITTTGESPDELV